MRETDQSIPDRLPLLDALLAERVGGTAPLKGVRAVLIQHQLGSQVPMTRALIQLGVEPQHVHWVDVPYTANATVRAALVGLGVPPENFVESGYRLDMAYTPYQRRRVAQLALKLIRLHPPDTPLLVLDDGSYFIEAMSCFATPIRHLRVVEQTTRGIIKIYADAALRDYCSLVTVKNVAESAPKKLVEGPLVGQAVCQALQERLAGELRGKPHAACLVLGFGAIGESAARSLADDAGIPRSRIHVLDPNPTTQARAAGQGFPLWDRSLPERQRFALVLGCTGTTSLTISDRVYLEDGAILASASSGSAELSREGFIELADLHPADDIYVYDRDTLGARPIHSDIRLRLVDRDVRFLNGGFPVNFDGQVNCVPPRLIQVTHALQVGAALEAMAATTRGLVELSAELCQWVEARFRDLSAS